jgi:hypothetical protein
MSVDMEVDIARDGTWDMDGDKDMRYGYGIWIWDMGKWI